MRGCEMALRWWLKSTAIRVLSNVSGFIVDDCPNQSPKLGILEEIMVMSELVSGVAEPLCTELYKFFFFQCFKLTTMQAHACGLT